MEEKMKWCPFCGGGSLRVASIMGNWHVLCVYCGARGPESKDKEEAIKAWNCPSGNTKRTYFTKR